MFIFDSASCNAHWPAFVNHENRWNEFFVQFDQNVAQILDVYVLLILKWIFLQDYFLRIW